MVATPRGARCPGAMKISILLSVPSDLRIASTTAEDSAGSVLAPVIASRPAAVAAGSTAATNPATKSLASAISM